MSRNLVFTTMINADKFEFARWNGYKMCIKSQELYAKRIGADFICQEEKVLNLSDNGNDEKLNLANHLEKYDRVLSLDADIMIAPTAPDIFVSCPDRNIVYMLNETRQNYEIVVRDMLPGIVKRKPHMEGIVKALEKNYRYPHYYNVGVILASRERRGLFVINNDYIKPIHWRSDQDFVNYKIYLQMAARDFVNDFVVSLPLSFNGMFVYNINAAHECHFIHFAGGHWDEMPHHFARLFKNLVDLDEFQIAPKDFLERHMITKDNARIGLKTMLWCMGRENMKGVEINSYTGEVTEILASKCDTLYAVDPWLSPVIENAFNTRVADLPCVQRVKAQPNCKSLRPLPDGLDFVYINGVTGGNLLSAFITEMEPKIKPDGFICGSDAYSPEIFKALNERYGRFDGVKLQMMCGDSWIYYRGRK
jgi:hypothetical protein